MKARLLIFIFFLTIAQSEALSYNLPIPEDTAEGGEQEVNFNGISYIMKSYQSQLSCEEIISFYKRNLINQGFILISEDKIRKFLQFRNPKLKENLMLIIGEEEDGLTDYFLNSWKGDKLFPQALTSERGQEKDFPGKDLPEVPRYPVSTRLTSIELGPMKNASYKTSHSPQEIITFYETNMPSYGWKRIGQDYSQEASRFFEGHSLFDILAKGNFLLFEKKNTICGIMVASGSDTGGCSGGSCCTSSACEVCGEGTANNDKSTTIGILCTPKQ
ncbi:MAG: hypothetical protein NC912_03790 [Candidatus Omnitrophica bacterium]|nr:hypothetical protein [Candidatus Omnitrophota bacterium]